MLALLLCASLVPATAFAAAPVSLPMHPQARRQPSAALTRVPTVRHDATSTRMLVRFAPQASASARADQGRGLGYRVKREIPSVGWTVIETLPGRSGQALMSEMQRSPLVEAVEFDVQVTLADVPNDPLYAGQWGYENSGQTGGTAGADISAEAAWDITTGSSDIVVAVADTGVDFGHPDLADNAWVNPGEIAGNGVDDDDNGYIDDVNGWDCVNNDATVFDAEDSDRHGTHVAGTIGAVGDNGIGVTGVNWDVSIMSGKFITPSLGYLSDAIEAITYAVDNGADVINNSWSVSSSISALEDAIDYAAEHGVVCVCAAANDGLDIDIKPTYPASYDTTNVVTVAATDHDDELASFSNFGIESVDLAAPGVDVTSTIPIMSAALHVVESPFEVMYFGFPIESMLDTDDRSAIYAQTMAELDPVGDGSVMVVDDSYPITTQDGAGVRLSVYTSELAAAGYTSISTWDVEADGMPTLADLGTGPVVWFTGGLSMYWYEANDHQFSIDSADRALLGDYLDAGGSLLLSSGGAGEDLDYSWGFDVAWYRDYLHAYCTDYYSWTDTVRGATGTIFDGTESPIDPYDGDVDGWSGPAGTDTLIAYDSNATSVIEWTTYAAINGTSMASPHVAGGIALVMSMNPGMTAYEAQTRIQATVDPVAGLAGKIATGGRMNVAAAMTDYPVAPVSISATPGSDGEMVIQWTDPSHAGHLATRLVRTFGTWPTGPDDGVLVYEGTEQSADETMLPHGADVRYAAYALDLWGNWSVAATTAVTAIDTTAPDDPGAFTATIADSDVQLSWTAPSASDLLGVRVLARTDTTPTGPGDGSARVVYEGSDTDWLDEGVLPPSQDTTIYYAAYAFDGNPNYSPGVSERVFADYEVPVGTFAINGGSATTTDADVTLDSSVTGATFMRFDTGAGFSDWIAYADSASGTLVGSDGIRTVDAQYKDDGGNLLILSDTIRLDTDAPTGTFSINAGSINTSDAVVTLNSDIAGATLMRFDLGGGFGDWTAWALTSTGTLVGGDGVRVVDAEYKDDAENLLVLSDSILLDTLAPSGTLAINGGAAGSTNAVVTLDSSVGGAAFMRFDTGAGFGEWEVYADSAFGTLVGGDGMRVVDAQYVDDTGNLLILSDSILLDTTPPGAPSGMLVAGSGNGVVALEWVPATDDDVVSHELQRAVGESGTWATYADLSATASGFSDVGLTNGTEYRYRVRAVDALGNAGAFSAQVSAVPDTTVFRLAGASRYETALRVSEATFASADTVVIATGQDFPDALGAAGLAGALDAPVLLTPSAALPSGLLDEIDRLGAKNAVIIGGESAVSLAVSRELSGHLYVRRISGPDRYATAAAVAQEVVGMSGAADVLIARGDGFADALAAGPLAYAAELPMLLVSASRVPGDTRDALATLGVSRAIVLGGEVAVPGSVADALGVEYDRAGADDRYGTAVAVAEYGVERGWVTWDTVGLATGVQFPDALGGGAAVGSGRGVLLLTRSDALPQATRSGLEGHAATIDTIMVMGGPVAVSDAVFGDAQAILDAR